MHQAQEHEQGRLRMPARVGDLWRDGLGVVSTRSVQVLVILAVAAVTIWGLQQVSLVVIPLLLGLIVAAALAPLVSLLVRRGWPRVLATVTVLLALVVVLGGAIAIVVAQVADKWALLSDRTLDGVNQLISWWNTTFPQFELNQQNINELWATVQGWISNLNYGALGSGVAAGLGSVGAFVAGLVLFIVILFFFVKDGPMIWSFLIRPLKDAQHRRAELMGTRAVAVLGGYVRGTVIVALVDAIFIGLGLVILQVPLAIPLALVVFICAFIPVVGATLAGVIAALVTLVTNGFVPAIIVVAIVVLVNQLEGNLLSPIVLGKSLALHELVVLLTLTVGTVLGGIIGTLIAVPLTAVGWALVKAWTEPLPALEQDADGESMAERWRAARERALARRDANAS
ncbi:AI-2E family transporter [Gulosibacter macacae]|nr:AI-2E family transporter [Gulosibacter macacae]